MVRLLGTFIINLLAHEKKNQHQLKPFKISLTWYCTEERTRAFSAFKNGDLTSIDDLFPLCVPLPHPSSKAPQDYSGKPRLLLICFLFVGFPLCLDFFRFLFFDFGLWPHLCTSLFPILLIHFFSWSPYTPNGRVEPGSNRLLEPVHT